MLAANANFGYMLLGYGTIFGLMFLYLLSWRLRQRNLEKDLEMLKTLGDQPPDD